MHPETLYGPPCGSYRAHSGGSRVRVRVTVGPAVGGYWSCKGVHNIPPSCSPFHSQSVTRVNQVCEGVTPGFGDPWRSHRAVTVNASASPGSLEAAKVGDAGGMQPALLVPMGSPLQVLHPCTPRCAAVPARRSSCSWSRSCLGY